MSAVQCTQIHPVVTCNVGLTEAMIKTAPSELILDWSSAKEIGQLTNCLTLDHLSATRSHSLGEPCSTAHEHLGTGATLWVNLAALPMSTSVQEPLSG